MLITPTKSREYLNKRHRLSHQQIDEFLGENRAGEFVSEKHDQLLQVSEFLNISDKLKEASVPFIPLKGPILSQKLYNDPSFRWSNDLDFLIPMDSIKETFAVLVENGYRPHNFDWPSNRIEEKFLLRFSNQILFTHLEKNINIEIHWKLFKIRILKSSDLSRIINTNCQKIEMNERSFQVFNNELELLYLIIHGGMHAWFRLKWLVDIKDYIYRISIEEEKFAQLVFKLKATRMVALCNSLLDIYFPLSKSLPININLKNERTIKFVLRQIEDEIYYRERSFKEKILTYYNYLNCFPGLNYMVSGIGVIIYEMYLFRCHFYPQAKKN